MKTIFKMSFFLLLSLFSFQSFSQNETKAVIANDLMNVFYIGIDNPINIAVPGITNDKINVTITNGTIKKDNGRYLVQVTNTSDVTINVSAENKMISSSIFRVKRIPDPSVVIGDQSYFKSVMTKEELLKAGELNVVLNLPFELKYIISSFIFSYNSGGGLMNDIAVNGNKFNQMVNNSINKLVVGQKIVFENIKAIGPDKVTRTLPPIIVTLIDK
jgi:gliding motility-associated protein GldM